MSGLLVDAAPFALLLVDKDGKIEVANSRVEEIFGYTRAELGGLTVDALLPPRFRTKHLRLRKEFFQWPKKRAMGQGRDLLGQRKDGAEIPIEVSLTPLQTEGGLRVLVAVVDISERKRGEERLHDALTRELCTRSALERKIIETEFLSQLTKDLSRSVSSREICRVLAHAVVPCVADWFYLAVFDRHQELRLSWAAHADPEKQPLAQKLERWATERGWPEWGSKLLQLKEPLIFPGALAAADDVAPECWPVFAAESPERKALLRSLGTRTCIALPLITRGETMGALIFVSGAENRRFGREEQKLIQEIVDRAALMLDNSILYEEAQRAVWLREEFIAVASHELRTPLTSVVMQLDLLDHVIGKRSGVEWPAPAKGVRLKALVETARRDIERFVRLVETLLDVSRISSQTVVLDREEVDLSGLVGTVVEGLRAILEANACTLTLELDPGATGRWDRVRLEQIISNLLSNAVKYGRGGPIEVRTSFDADCARLAVRDSGPGISRADQERIFERFERAASTRSYGGLGLGLYVTRELVKAHGGRVWVESEPGKGATFNVELPRQLEGS